MIMNAMKVDLTIMLCILYIAVVYNSDRDFGMEKLRIQKPENIILKWLTKINSILIQITSAFTMKLGFTGRMIWPQFRTEEHILVDVNLICS